MSAREKQLWCFIAFWILAFVVSFVAAICSAIQADYWWNEYDKLKAAQPSGAGINQCGNMVYGKKYGFWFDVFWSQRPQAVVYVGDNSITDEQCIVRVEHLVRGKDGKWTLPPAH